MYHHHHDNAETVNSACMEKNIPYHKWRFYPFTTTKKSVHMKLLNLSRTGFDHILPAGDSDVDITSG